MARGRPRGSRNKPKSDGVGHNSGEAAPMAASDEAPVSIDELTDDQKQVLFFQHRNLYKSALEAKKAAVAAFKNTCKLAKAECGDHAVADIKTSIELESPEGEAELKARIERNLRVARWMGASIGTQGDMFGEDRTPAVDRAFDDGKRACMNGEPKKPPHDPSVPQYARWMEGYQHAEGVILSGLKRPDDFAERSAALAVEGQKLADEMFGTEPQNPRMSRAEWKAHLAKQNAEVAADIKAGSIGTEPATAGPAGE